MAMVLSAGCTHDTANQVNHCADPGCGASTVVEISKRARALQARRTTKRLRHIDWRRTVSQHIHCLQQLLGLPITSRQAEVLSVAIELIGSHANVS